MSSNPYAAPNAVVSELAPSIEEQARLKRVASGQRMMVWSVLGMILVNVLARPERVGDVGYLFGGLLSLVCIVFSIIGAVRLARALGSNVIMCVLGAICMIIPLVNLITMVLMSMRATRALKAAGYKVGLLGARGI
jgi:hypothetical protein